MVQQLQEQTSLLITINKKVVDLQHRLRTGVALGADDASARGSSAPAVGFPIQTAPRYSGAGGQSGGDRHGQASGDRHSNGHGAGADDYSARLVGYLKSGRAARALVALLLLGWTCGWRDGALRDGLRRGASRLALEQWPPLLMLSRLLDGRRAALRVLEEAPRQHAHRLVQLCLVIGRDHQRGKS